MASGDGVTIPFDPTPLSLALLVWIFSASTPSIVIAFDVVRAPDEEMI
jgi:hypothetical protein